MALVCSTTEVQLNDRKHILQTSTPELSQSVSLHILCENCRRFVEQDEFKHWHQESLGYVRSPAWHYHCTLDELEANQDFCHLCIHLLAELESKWRRENKDVRDYNDYNIYLQLWNDGRRAPHLRAVVTRGPQGEILDETSTIMTALDVRTYTDTGAFDQHVTARRTYLQARDNLPRAKHWIQTCLSEHIECHAFSCDTRNGNHQRPTRVLELTSTTVRLRCNMADENFDYLVLSHMWGDSSQVRATLKVSNLDEYQVNIPFDVLSDIYLEAIHATLTLGYKYLWIDSLCIIQDLNDDWKHEAERMALVYGNAVCNLAYLFPSSHPHSQQYARPRSDPRICNPCILIPSTPTSPGVYVQHETITWSGRTGFYEQHPWLDQRNWPLFTRGWTFQEHLLAPRTLLLGHVSLMWQCSRFFYDELLGPLYETPSDFSHRVLYQDLNKKRYFPSSMPKLRHLESPSEPVAIDFIKDWFRCVKEYRGRDFTYAKDRIVAFAGIARAFANLGKLTYLAGLWAEVLPLCLLWVVRRSGGESEIDNPESTCDVREPVKGSAPSWSWFSVPVYKSLDVGFLLENDEIGQRMISSTESYFDDIYWISEFSFRFGEREKDHFQDQGYSDFEHLQLTLMCPLLPFRVSWPAEIDKQLENICKNNQLDANIKWTFKFDYFPDDPRKIDKGPPRNGMLALVAEYQTCEMMAGFSAQRRYVGLVVAPGRRRDSWKRVGVLKLKVRIRNRDVKKADLKEAAERWREYDVVGERWQMGMIMLE